MTRSSEIHSTSGLTSGAGLDVGAGLEDEHAPHHAELGGGEADPERPLHEGDHPLGLRSSSGPKLGHLGGPRLQHRVAELADLAERLAAPLESLLVELRVFTVGRPRRPRARLSSALGHAPILGGSRTGASLGIDVDRERRSPLRTSLYARDARALSRIAGDVATGGCAS